MEPKGALLPVQVNALFYFTVPALKDTPYKKLTGALSIARFRRNIYKALNRKAFQRKQ